MNYTATAMIAALLLLGSPLNSSLAEQMIQGDYLPESELPKSVCKIHADALVTIVTPTFRNFSADGRPGYEYREENPTLCTASLIRPNAILTAAHCHVGVNEQQVITGKIQYPYTEDGTQRLPHCEGDHWFDNPECKPIQVNGTSQQKWINPKLTCPTLDGKTETRVLSDLSGYPNPLFGEDQLPPVLSRRSYDSAVWFIAEPLMNTPLMEVSYDPAALDTVMSLNRLSCRTFGYGTDNDQKAGTLRGAYTPLTFASKAHAEAHTKENEKKVLAQMGMAQPGDSGGPLVCQDAQGNDQQFGITSWGRQEKPDEAHPEVTPLTRSMYALPSLNQGWIDLVLKEAPATRPSGREWWYDFSLKYQIAHATDIQTQTDSCLKRNRFKIGADYPSYVEEFKRLNEIASQAQKDYVNHKITGLFLAKVREYRDPMKKMLWACLRSE